MSEGAPGDPGGTLFLRECGICGGLAKLVNGLDPGDERICVGCLQLEIQERKLLLLQQPRARMYGPFPWPVEEPSPWKREREEEG